MNQTRAHSSSPSSPVSSAPKKSRGRAAIALAAAIAIGAAVGLLLRSSAGDGAADVVDGRSLEAERPSFSARPEQPLASAGPAGETHVGDLEEPEPRSNPLMDAPRDQFHPRDPDEWQGMLVNTAVAQYCEATEYCGLALSCSPDNQCGACTQDAECGQGEACVLDHCVVAENVTCRTRSDCAHLGGDALCLLSGVTGGDPRGNSDMRSFCQLPVGGVEQVASAERETQRQALLAGQKFEPAVTSDALFARLAASAPTTP